MSYLAVWWEAIGVRLANLAVGLAWGASCLADFQECWVLGKGGDGDGAQEGEGKGGEG